MCVCGAKVSVQKCFHLSVRSIGECENAMCSNTLPTACIQLYQFAFRDPISDLVVTADYDLIELLYNFLRNGFQPDRNKISNEVKLGLMSGKEGKKC